MLHTDSSCIFTSIMVMTRRECNHIGSFCIQRHDSRTDSSLIDLLSNDELDRMSAMSHAKRRASFLHGRSSAKMALKSIVPDLDYTETTIATGVFQFPVVRTNFPSNLAVSITHFNNFSAAIAFPEDHPMGIDLEGVDDAKISYLTPQFSAAEIARAREVAGSLATGCVLLWTLREALSKVLRTGLVVNMTILEVAEMVALKGSWNSLFVNFPQFRGVSILVDNKVLSLVLPKNSEILSEKELLQKMGRIMCQIGAQI